jgi:hypothetical protein
MLRKLPKVMLLILASMTAAAAYATAAAYEPAPWLEDLEQARQVLLTKYANLEWAVFERQADLPALFLDAGQRINAAKDDAEARAAFDTLARKLGDGHVRFKWPGQSSAGKKSAASPCEALGYDAAMVAKPLAAFMPGYSPLGDALAPEFPAGLIEAAGRRVGVVKIGLFSPGGFPDLCAAALLTLQIPKRASCDTGCSARVDAWVSNRITRDLDARLRAMQAAGAEVLLVDIADNGGGTEWAEAAARMLTAVRLKSARVGFVRGAHWARSFADQEAGIRALVKGAGARDRALLGRLAVELAARRRDAETPCDAASLWKDERPECAWLGEGFYGSGLLDSADPVELRSKSWAADVFTPMQFPYEEGVWRGPLIVLVNGGTGSAAEEFAAVLQDNGAAVIMGATTAGAGCGHTNGGTPTTLKNSGAVFEVPDCVRFRKDGSNEVMGIQPDVFVGLRWQDGPRRRGLRVAEKLPSAVELALPTAQRVR